LKRPDAGRIISHEANQTGGLNMGFRDELKELSEKIKTYRDEARVQLHLASEEAKDEWSDIEENWEKFRGRLDELWDDAENASKDVREKTHELGEDLKESYEKLRNRLK
jgi:chromosome segregation ATPase